jgi:hypothetical protein
MTTQRYPQEMREQQMETITSKDGTSIAYRRSGEGPPLVLVHGAAADHGRWRPVLPAFEERFTVYAIDRRGRGGSGDADGYAIEREFEDVASPRSPAPTPSRSSAVSSTIPNNRLLLSFGPFAQGSRLGGSMPSAPVRGGSGLRVAPRPSSHNSVCSTAASLRRCYLRSLKSAWMAVPSARVTVAR